MECNKLFPELFGLVPDPDPPLAAALSLAAPRSPLPSRPALATVENMLLGNSKVE